MYNMYFYIKNNSIDGSILFNIKDYTMKWPALNYSLDYIVIYNVYTSPDINDAQPIYTYDNLVDILVNHPSNKLKIHSFYNDTSMGYSRVTNVYNDHIKISKPQFNIKYSANTVEDV